MQALTGIKYGMEDMAGELNVSITDFSHPITKDLPQGYVYGTGIDRDQYLRPPKIEYLPETVVSPAFYADDSDARVLGIAQSTCQPGLVVKDFGNWRSIYSTAPLLPWQLLRNIARQAGVHIYDDQGDMIWANNTFLAVYSQTAGQRTIRFPRSVTVEDAYEGSKLGTGITSLNLDMSLWETRLFFISNHFR
jgi:hypothetical protein